MEEQKIYTIADEFFFNDYEEKANADEQTMLNYSYFVKGLKKAFEFKPSSPPSMPELITDEEIKEFAGATMLNPNLYSIQEAYEEGREDGAKWMRSRFEGIVKHKAIRFTKWKESLQPRQLITVHGDGQTPYVRDLTEEELYEIFNQQER